MSGGAMTKMYANVCNRNLQPHGIPCEDDQTDSLNALAANVIKIKPRGKKLTQTILNCRGSRNKLGYYFPKVSTFPW